MQNWSKDAATVHVPYMNSNRVGVKRVLPKKKKKKKAKCTTKTQQTKRVSKLTPSLAPLFKESWRSESVV